MADMTRQVRAPMSFCIFRHILKPFFPTMQELNTYVQNSYVPISMLIDVLKKYIIITLKEWAVDCPCQQYQVETRC